MIRIATLKDKSAIVRMLESYRKHSPLEFHKTSPMEHGEKIIEAVLTGAGVCFVSEDADGIHGMLLAIKNPNIWNPAVMAIHELAYWVDEHKRGGTAGYKLLKMYVDYCKTMKDSGAIEYFTISKMVTSPNLDYNRFGFSKLEEMWRA